jgi:hypothetical protein
VFAAGAVAALAGLAVTGGPANLAALGLFVQAVASTATRWWAGRYGDRHGPASLLVPGVVVTAAGIGAGAFGFGVAAARTSYPAAFAVTALLVLAALVPLWRDRVAVPEAWRQPG